MRNPPFRSLLPRALLAMVASVSMALLAACAHPAGPVPVLSEARLSTPGLDGRTTLRTKVRVDFEGLPTRKPREAAAHLFEHVTFTLEDAATRTAAGDVRPLLVADRAEVLSSGSSRWPERVVADVVAFPQTVPGQKVRLVAESFHQRPDDDPGFTYLEVPEALGPGCPRIRSVRLEAAGERGRSRIIATTEDDVAEDAVFWHVAGGRVDAMERKGSRIFSREFPTTPEGTPHMVFAETGPCITPPHAPMP